MKTISALRITEFLLCKNTVLALKQWLQLRFMNCAWFISSETYIKMYFNHWINLEFLWLSLKVVKTPTRVDFVEFTKNDSNVSLGAGSFSVIVLMCQCHKWYWKLVLENETKKFYLGSWRFSEIFWLKYSKILILEVKIWKWRQTLNVFEKLVAKFSQSFQKQPFFQFEKSALKTSKELKFVLGKPNSFFWRKFHISQSFGAYLNQSCWYDLKRGQLYRISWKS